MAIKHHEESEDAREVRVKKFHIDGAGPRPDGTGSGWAWVNIGNGKRRIKWIDGLTNNEAEYAGLIGVLEYVSFGSDLEISTDSQLVCNQFNRRWAVYEPRLHRLLHKALRLIEEKQLDVDVRWIPRRENLAGKLLDRC